MSKKHRKLKKRIKANRRDFAHDPYVKNVHHLCWIGARWNSHYHTKLLRNYWYCQVYIPKNTLHRWIHQDIPNGLSVPSETTARSVYNRLLEMEKLGELSPKDNIIVRLELLISLFGDNDPATVRGLEQQLRIANQFYRKPP